VCHVSESTSGEGRDEINPKNIPASEWRARTACTNWVGVRTEQRVEKGSNLEHIRCEKNGRDEVGTTHW